MPALIGQLTYAISSYNVHWMILAELEALRKRLHDLRHELEGRLAANASGVRPVSLDEPIGRLSRMDAIQQQQMAGAQRRQAELRLRQVQSALSRIQAGSYGICLRCEGPISAARLKAKPEATLCRQCQGSSE
jgi:DnaK suppressor protein